jgi:hypothetical protein
MSDEELEITSRGSVLTAPTKAIPNKPSLVLFFKEVFSSKTDGGT